MGSILLAALSAAALLTNCADVAMATFAKHTNTPFEIIGSVSCGQNNGSPHLNVSDETGGTLIVDITNDPQWKSIRNGDILKIRGVILLSTNGMTSARCRQLTFLRHEAPPQPIEMDFSAFNDGRLDCRKVRAHGKVMEVFVDEIDPQYIYASLDCHGNITYLTFQHSTSIQERLLQLRDAEVTVVGEVSSSISNARRSLGRTIGCRSLDDLTVNTPPPADVFAVPTIPFESSNFAAEILPAGRRRTIGTVIAVRSGRRVYLREKSDETRSDETRCAKLAAIPMPSCGELIEVAGLPETDFYRINLTDADWRSLGVGDLTNRPAERISIAHLLTDEQGRPRITSTHHGRLVRIEGLIVDQPSVGGFQDVLMLKDGDLVIPVELTTAKESLKKTSVGSRIAVTGICIVETETWCPTAGFPHATGVVIVPRSADDIVVLSRPPWWTPLRFLILIAVLFVLLVAILVWNRILQAVIRRKSHQLMREQLAKARSELRVSERTNLAIELHDALSQNLSGLAFQLATAKSALTADPSALPRHLDTAERMLISSRTELKHCLSDLRDNTLDEKDFVAAIRQTLVPVVNETSVSIQFTVPRQKLADTTAHAILCIIRELAANAVLHGHATQLDIRGTSADGKLAFSVRDNGSGFDPKSRPGLADGHYGLDGIHERVEHLKGSLVIDSTPGRGTCVTISNIGL